MPSRPWFQWFAADYLADTLHLSETEDLLYRRLLDALWMHGPLPEDLRKISKICRIDLRKVRRSYPVLEPMLDVSNGLIDHWKIREQREKVADISRKRANSGRKGGKAIASNSLQAIAAIRARDPDPDPYKDKDSPLIPPTENATKSKPKPRAKSPAADAASFDRFWQRYPRKVSKAQARKAWAALKPDDALQADIMAGLDRAIASDPRFDNGYTPHAATWLRAEGWTDEHSPDDRPLTPIERLERANPSGVVDRAGHGQSLEPDGPDIRGETVDGEFRRIR